MSVRSVVRICQLAKELGVESRQVIHWLFSEGFGQAPNHLSVVWPGVAQTVRERFAASAGNNAIAVGPTATILPRPAATEPPSIARAASRWLMAPKDVGYDDAVVHSWRQITRTLKATFPEEAALAARSPRQATRLLVRYCCDKCVPLRAHERSMQDLRRLRNWIEHGTHSPCANVASAAQAAEAIGLLERISRVCPH